MTPQPRFASIEEAAKAVAPIFAAMLREEREREAAKAREVAS